MNAYANMSIKELLDKSSLKESNELYNLELAKKYIEVSQWSEAAESASRALTINGVSEEALTILATIQELRGDNIGAIELLDRLKKITDCPNASIRKINLLLNVLDYNSALNEVIESLERFPSNHELLRQKCKIFARMNKIEECLSTFEKLVKISNNVLDLYEYAVHLRLFDKESEAKILFKQLMESRDQLPLEFQNKIERYLEEYNIERPHFKAGARLLIQLGEQMIENENVALSELIKNAYDARSKKVDILVDTNYKEQGEVIGKIVIKDYGKGMTRELIENHWLFISTNRKQKIKMKKDSDFVPLGEKGIGRLSAHRLGHKLLLESSVEGESRRTSLEVDWELFENNPEASLDEVDVILSEMDEEITLSYTSLTITKLRNPSFWEQLVSNSKKKAELQQSLFSMISPFKELQHAFSINITVNEEKIPMETIDEDLLDIISTIKLDFDFYFDEESKEWKSKSLVTLTPEFYSQKTRPHINKLKEQDEKWLKTYLKEVKLPDGPLSFSKSWSQTELYEELNDLWEIKMFGFKSPGPFQLKIFAFTRGDTNSRKIVEDKLADLFAGNIKKRVTAKQYFDSISGIKIYRDGFRIFPYGDPKNDWLRLNASATTSGSYEDIKSENSTGYVKLTGQNVNLREKTNREGFISDVYSNVFFRLTELAVKHINRTIQTELTEIREVYKKINNKIIQEIEEKNKITEMATKNMEQVLKNAMNTNDGKTPLDTETAKLITSTAFTYTEKAKEQVVLSKKQSAAMQSQYDEMLTDVEQITELAGLGMLMEAFTHEYGFQSTKLKQIVNELKLNVDHNIKRQLLQMNAILNEIDGYIKYLAPSFQKERKRRVRMDLHALIKKLYGYDSESFIVSKAKRNNIQINIYGDESFIALGNQGLITQIIDNLYINSEYWLNNAENLGYISEKTFNITIEYKERQIIIWDNGRGISPSMEQVLFEAFQTEKNDESGRGLGLYITKTLCEMLKIRISLSNEINEFGRKYKFILDFSKNGG